MKNFNSLLRGYTLPMSIAPFLVAFMCALHAPLPFDWMFALSAFLAFLGVILVHAAVNLFDDYIDVKTQLNNGLELNQICFKSVRKARTILDGTFSIDFVEKLLISLISVAVLIGGYFIYLRGGVILLYMIITGILALFYPKSSKYGLCELITGIVFGPLLVNAVYYAITGQFDPIVFNLSFAVGIMTTILSIAHSIMDYEFDVEANKKSVPVLLKDKEKSINFIVFLIILSYLIVFFTMQDYALGAVFMLPILLTAHIAYKLKHSLIEYIQIKDVQFIPKWYFGLMENWEEICKNNYAYFMYRFYLARNLSVAFNLFLAIACFISFHPVFELENFIMNVIWGF